MSLKTWLIGEFQAISFTAPQSADHVQQTHLEALVDKYLEALKPPMTGFLDEAT